MHAMEQRLRVSCTGCTAQHVADRPEGGLVAATAAGWKDTDFTDASNGVCEHGGIGLGLVGGCLMSMRLMWRAAAASVCILGANAPSTPGMALDGGGSLACLRLRE